MRFLAYTFSVSFPLFSQSLATVSGIVQTETGQAIPNAVVWLAPRPPFATGVPQAQNLQTGTDGTFSFSASAGNYEICASATGADYLDSCAWNAVPGSRTFAVAPSQRLAAPAIRLEKGARFRVAFTDPAGRLEQGAGQARMLVKIGVPGMGFTMMPVVEDTGARRTYEMLVPRQRPVKLRLVSGDVAIADSQDKAVAIAAGHDREIVLPATGAPPPLSFRVTGVSAR